jgi:hypothetical protein
MISSLPHRPCRVGVRRPQVSTQYPRPEDLEGDYLKDNAIGEWGNEWQHRLHQSLPAPLEDRTKVPPERVPQVGKRLVDGASTRRSGEMRRSRNLSYALASHLAGSPSRIIPPPVAAFRTTSTPVNISMSLSDNNMEAPSVGWRRATGGRAVDRTSSDKSTYSGPHPNSADTPARDGLPLSAAAGSKLLWARP